MEELEVAEDGRRELSRRAMIGRTVAAGTALAWAVPTVEALGVRSAWAGTTITGGSPVPTPQLTPNLPLTSLSWVALEFSIVVNGVTEYFVYKWGLNAEGLVYGSTAGGNGDGQALPCTTDFFPSSDILNWSSLLTAMPTGLTFTTTDTTNSLTISANKDLTLLEIMVHGSYDSSINWTPTYGGTFNVLVDNNNPNAAVCVYDDITSPQSVSAGTSLSFIAG